MGNKLKTYKDILKTIAYLVGAVFLAIVLKIVDNLMGNGIPLKEYIILCIVVIVLVSVLYILITVFISKYLDLLYPHYSSEQYPITQKCKYEDNICCANIAVDAIKSDYKFVLNDDISEKYNLISEEELLDYESTFDNGEIWIFSYDLTTEVLNDKASELVKKNIERGIVYREFFIDNNLDPIDTASYNREKMENWYGKGKIKFYPYDNPDSLLNYIFALFGIAIYIEGNEHDVKIKAFFSLRSADSRIKRPIYVKMPHCMTDRYYRILKNIIDSSNI